MATITLPISLSGNKILNPDGITTLRQINFVQGDTYTVNLSFLNGDVPAIVDFSFNLRNDAGTNLVSVSEVFSGSSYPYYFSLPLTSPSLITSASFQTLNAYLSYSTSGGIEVLAPFKARIATVSSGVAGAYVSSLNSLTGAVLATGAGNVSVSAVGNTLTFSGDVSTLATKTALNATGSTLNASLSALNAATGTFYPRSNPSGFLTSSSLSALNAATGTLQTATGTLQTEISAIQAATGSFYLSSNPSGFLQSSALTPYALTSALNSSGLFLQGEITSLQSATGSYALSSALSATGSLLQNEITTLQAATGSYLVSSSLSALNSSTGALQAATGTLQGEISTLQGQTGNYYPRNSNPSGYVSSLPTNLVYTTGNQIISGLKQFDTVEILSSFSSSVITDGGSASEVNLSSAYVRNPGGDITLNWQSQILSGNWSTVNPTLSGHLVTKYYADNQLSGASGTLQTSISSLQSATGGYYPRTNPSGYISTLPATVVLTSGNQTINGTKTFTSPIDASQLGENGSVFINLSAGTLNLSNSEGDLRPSVDWGNLLLNNSSTSTTLDWGNQILNGQWSVETPTTGTSIANKAYVDSHAGGGPIALHRDEDFEYVTGGDYEADDTLTIAVAANDVIHIEGVLFVNGDGGLTINGPDGSSGKVRWDCDGTIGIVRNNIGDDLFLNSTTVIHVRAVIENGSTAGNVALFGKNADSTVTVEALSGLTFTKE